MNISRIHRNPHHHPHLQPPKEHRDIQSTAPNVRGNHSTVASEDKGRATKRKGSPSRSASTPCGEYDSTGSASVASGRKHTFREGDVEAEKERGLSRASDIRDSVVELNTLSNDTTRRLDDTYYAILEKLSSLCNTIVSLRELANMTSQLNTEFTIESEEVFRVATAQLDSFEDFTEQERRIRQLEKRVDVERDKIGRLARRVKIVSGRVNGWERREGEWQDKTRRMRRIFWGCVTVVLAVMVGLQMAQRWTYQSPDIRDESISALNTSFLIGKVISSENLENDTVKMDPKLRKNLEKLKKQGSRCGDGQEKLRIFDEL